MASKRTKASDGGKAASRERMVDRWLRTQYSVSIKLDSRLTVDFEINPDRCLDYWMLNFGQEYGCSIEAAEAAALIAAANGPKTTLRSSKRVLSKDQLEELREAASEGRSRR